MSGVMAALAHKLVAWHSLIPLVGASGAVAGLLGAFAWGHAKTQVRPFAWARSAQPGAGVAHVVHLGDSFVASWWQ